MEASYKTVLYEKRNDIAFITLNRPQVGNATNHIMQRELVAIWKDFAEDASLKVAVLTGQGRSFCSGLDLREAAGSYRRGEKLWGMPEGRIAWPPQTLKPKICAVNGAAIGGGLNMMLSCDIIVGAENATFSVRYVAHGYPAGGPALELAMRTSVGTALWMALTAQTIDAQSALRVGLVDEVVPLPQLMPRATQLAEMIATNSPAAIRATKEKVMKYMDLAYRQALSYVGPAESHARESIDYREGATAYAEKRQARFEES